MICHRFVDCPASIVPIYDPLELADLARHISNKHPEMLEAMGWVRV
ncbi:MAG: hypothetical protein PHC39_04745 [Proteiniphilum sp.]|nr:hypothetical protein [Proteiniphilum sp.]